MSTPVISALRHAIVSDLHAHLPHLRECRVHPGRFDLAELRRLSALTPALLVACLGVVGSEELPTGERSLELAMGAFVVTGPQRGLDKDDAAVNIVEALCVHLPAQRWGLSWVGDGRDVRAENLYSGEVDRAAVAFWAVSWRHLVRLGVRWDDGPAGVLPHELYVGHTPLVGGEHLESYEPIDTEQLP